MSAPENGDITTPSISKEEDATVPQDPSVTQAKDVEQPTEDDEMTNAADYIKEDDTVPEEMAEAPEVAVDDVDEPEEEEEKPDEENHDDSDSSNEEEDGELKELSEASKEEREAPVKEDERSDTPDESMEDVEPAAAVPSSQPPTRSSSVEPKAAPKPAEGDIQREQHYSTRGRHASRETDQDILHDRLGKSEEDELAGKSKTETAISFLDSLDEEGRRTRTRFLPDVDGIHVLYKAEVKQDLQLARTVMSSAGVSSTLSSASRRNNKSNNRAPGGRRGEDENADMGDEEDDGTPSPMEDDGLSTDSVGISGYTAVENGAAVPSRAFVAPPPEASDGGDGDSKSNTVPSPHVVESVTAFNPPRPPESVGPKKKHRLVRWERRPQDVEVDLNSYRKTVQRTRSELENARGERTRIEAVSAHLRAHFLAQAQALNEEGALLSEELGSVQLGCVKAADLLQSRTRSRGVGKGSYVMKDVLIILKQKGAEIANLPGVYEGVTEGEVTSGIGGISSKAFVDWERGQKVEPAKPATGWILPGNIVNTPYGKGTAIRVFGPADLDVATKPVEGAIMKPAETPSSAPKRHGFGGAEPSNGKETMNGSGAPAPDGNSNKEPEKKSAKKKKSKDKSTVNEEHTSVPAAKLDQLLAPRVCVKLTFGVGYFPLVSVSAQEDVSSYSDSMLASRWQKMTETALSVAGCVDHAAMANIIGGVVVPSKEENDEMDVDDEAEQEADQNGKDDPASQPFLPYGSSMFPTAAGRAARLHDAHIADLEGELTTQMLGNEVVLGDKDNKGVPAKFREWEDIRDELSVLRASVLQRRNELAGQRRVRALNERAFTTTRDKSLRVEHLVSEMRADLKSLKDRLDYELIELGIDGEKADCLLSAHYKEEDSKTDFATSSKEVASPPKRQRREKEASRASPKQTRAPRRRAEGASGTDDDFDESRPNTKRARPNQ